MNYEIIGRDGDHPIVRWPSGLVMTVSVSPGSSEAEAILALHPDAAPLPRAEPIYQPNQYTGSLVGPVVGMEI